MKVIAKLVPACLAFGMVANAYADWVYAHPPVWMTDYPEAISCTYDLQKNQSGIHCLPDGISIYAPPIEKVVLYNPLTQRYHEEYKSIIMSGRCNNNICLSSGTDIGRVNNWDFQLQVAMLHGYYFYGSGKYIDQGENTAYRFGTGPLGHMYPQYEVLDTGNVFGESSTPEPFAANSAVTYELWCSPREDLCSYTDANGNRHRLERDELPDYIPIATDVSDCADEVCYDANGDVIGLNPGWSSWGG